MKKKKSLISITTTAFVVSGGLLALSAVTVPGVVNQSVVAQKVPLQQNVQTTALVNSTVPVMKVEADVPVSTVETYLKQTMTEEEIKQIYNYIDSSKKEASGTNRELTKSEDSRLLALRDKYVYDGLRPATSLPLKPGNYDFYLDAAKDTYMYPKRSLTDEELLQQIDWSFRVDYALSKRHPADAIKPGAKDIYKKEALALAGKSVKKLFNVDVSKLEAVASLTTFPSGKQKIWMIHFQLYKADTLKAKGQPYLSYVVMVDSTTGTVIDTTVVDLSYKRTPISSAISQEISKDDSWVQEAKQIITEKMGETRAIKNAKYVKNAENDKRGMVSILITLEDGSIYDAELRYPEKTLRCLLYKPAKSLAP